MPVTNPFSDANLGLPTQSRSFNPSATDWTRARVEAPDKFQFGNTNRLSYRVAPPQVTKTPISTTTPDATTTPPETEYPTPVLPPAEKKTHEQVLAGQQSWWSNLLQTNPQSFEATIQGILGHQPNYPGYTSWNPSEVFQLWGGTESAQPTLDAYRAQHGFYPWEVDSTGTYYKSGQSAMVPFLFPNNRTVGNMI